jgi:hypothetical protein
MVVPKEPVEGEAPGEVPVPPEGEVSGEEKKDEEAPAAPADQTPPTDDTVEVPVEKVRWMYETAEEGWKVYSVDASRELEEASRDGKTDHTLTLGTQVHKCKLETKKHTRDDADGEFRLRRHVLGDGLAGMWEVLTMKFERPSGLYGLSVLKLLEKVWGQKETMSGKQCGLGFMFLYSLFTGDSRAKVSGGGDYGGGKSSFVGPFRYGGKSSGGGGGNSSNDSHRFALLLTQLYTDKHTKSLPGSVINVLGKYFFRNYMPLFSCFNVFFILLSFSIQAATDRCHFECQSLKIRARPSSLRSSTDGSMTKSRGLLWRTSSLNWCR